MRQQQKQRGIKGTFNFSVRDFLLIMSLAITGGNLAQCWKHSNEIDELQKLLNPKPKIAKEIGRDEKNFAINDFILHLYR